MTMHKARFRRPGATTLAARVRPVFDDFHLLWMDGDHEYPRHRHANYELILVDRGPYRCALNGVELVLGAGEVLVIKPGDEHQDHLRRGQRHYVVHFRLLAAEAGQEVPALFLADAAPADQIARGDHRRDAGLIRELRREAEERGLHAGVVQDCVLEALFWRTVRSLPGRALGPAMRRLPGDASDRVRLEDLFRRHLRDNPTLRELAGELKWSVRHLHNRCRVLFGSPPARVLLDRRLARAEELLRFHGYRVKEASAELGFANPYHFSAAYRRRRGRPPSG